MISDDHKNEANRALAAEGVDELHALAIALHAEFRSTVPAWAEGPADWLESAGEMLDLLDEYGWYFTAPSVPAEPEPAHPASAEQRLAVIGALRGDDLALPHVDSLARWVGDGRLPSDQPAPSGGVGQAELDAAAEALREWEGVPALSFGAIEEAGAKLTEVTDMQSAAGGLAHALRAILNAAGA